MITSCKTDVTTKSTFIQFVFAQFPEHLHEHVEHELLYHFEELEQGRMTLQEFAESVRASAVIREDELAKNVANKAIFEGVQTLIEQGVFKDASFVSQLTHEIELGDDSMLARFISLQPVQNSLDAALSFLAWKHMKALVELEEAFDVSLDHFRSAKEPEYFCTSESNMALLNFSVMSR
jgi:hypothetical protein